MWVLLIGRNLRLLFFDRFYPLDMIEAKVLGFINLHQRNMSLKDYSLKIMQFSKYTPTMFVDPRARTNKFLASASTW